MHTIFLTEDGETSLEYVTLLTCLSEITNSLKSLPGGKADLATKFKAEAWISINVEPNEEALLKLVLQRITRKTTQFYIFLRILSNITGMDQAAELLTKRKKEIYSTIVCNE